MQRIFKNVITATPQGSFTARYVTIPARLPAAAAAAKVKANAQESRAKAVMTAITPAPTVTATEKCATAPAKSLMKASAETATEAEKCAVQFATPFRVGIFAPDVTAKENRSARVQTARIQKRWAGSATIAWGQDIC